MHDKKLLWLALCSLSISTISVHAEEVLTESKTTNIASNSPNTSNSLKDLKQIRPQNFKVNANAAQPDEVKDPLQPLNRQIFKFNDTLDRTIVRPIAVQYKEKFPSEVRSSYHSFRSNLGEPWNAVNQTIQGRPKRTLKTLGRFTINTLTTLGLADPASRLGLDAEDENFGTTLGYYGVSSGPYLVLPIFGPSTIRDGVGLAVDAFGRPQNYMHKDSLYWTDQGLRGIDARTQLLDVEDVLQGDKYAAIRDIYLQRKNFVIAEKKGIETSDMLFINDEPEELDEKQDDIIDYELVE